MYRLGVLFHIIIILFIVIFGMDSSKGDQNVLAVGETESNTQDLQKDNVPVREMDRNRDSFDDTDLETKEVPEQVKRLDLTEQNYVPRKDVKVRERKRHPMRDPNVPKRPLSAFFWFTNDERSKMQASYPEYSLVDIARELGRRWIAADPETKAKYEAVYERDQARYDREMAEYKQGVSLAITQAQEVTPLESDHENDSDVEGNHPRQSKST